MRRHLTRAAVVAAVLLAGIAPAAAHAGPRPEVSPVIRSVPSGTVPEGVAWDPTRRAFLVGSVRHGTVSVLRRDGTLRPLVDDPAAVSTFGLTVDARRGLVLATYADGGLGENSSPATTGTLSGLLVADLRTGRVLRRIPVQDGPGPHGANDVALDRHGVAWVTDTSGDAVYRVDPRSGVLGVVRDPRFASDSFGVNGIVVTPAGDVLTTRYDTGQMFRIRADGRRVDAVTGLPPLLGADGMVQRADGTLAVITNRLGADGFEGVSVLHVAGTSARLVRVERPWADPFPTTGAATPAGTYVLSGRLDRLLAGDTSPAPFTLRRVPG